MADEGRFDGIAFAKSLATGQAKVSVRVEMRGVVGTSADGEQIIVPFSGCKVTQGGFSGKTYFVSTPDGSLCIGSDQPGFRESLVTAQGGVLSDQLDGLRRETTGRKIRWSTAGLLTLACVVALLVGGYYALMAGARATVRSLPVSVDKQIGDAMIDSMIDGKEVSDRVVEDAIRSIVKRLEAHANPQGFEFRVHVVQGDQINAFALPGGQIVVFTELIRKANQPEEVAGVIAHEMAHVTKRHGLQGVAQSIGLSAALGLVFGDASGIAGDLTQHITLSSYSRAQESEADAEGVRMMHAAKIDPRGLSRFFNTLKREAGDVPGGMQWISTHPSHDDRIDSIDEQLGELDAQQYQPFEFDWNAVGRRLR